MDWSKFYANKPINSTKYLLGNYYFYELFDEILKRKPSSVLEVGVGTGCMSSFLGLLGYKIIGIDLDPKIIEKAIAANNHFHGKAQFKVMDAFHLTLPNNSVDVVFSQGLMEHFDEDKLAELIKEQWRVAKKAIIISVPNTNCGLHEFGNETLYSLNQWTDKIRRISDMQKQPYNLSSYNYLTMLRKDHPVRTVYNLIRNKKIETMLIIDKK